MGCRTTHWQSCKISNVKKVDYLEHWGIIEADFLREYSVDLINELKEMTYRRFVILLQGLSPNSVWFNLVSNMPLTIEDPKAAEKYVNSIWK